MSMSMKPATLAEATKRVGEILGMTNAKRLGKALAAALEEELEQRPAFAERIKSLYEESAPAPAKRDKAPTTPRSPKTALTNLVPIKHVDGFEFNPAAPMDPYLLHEAFGPNQLLTILDALPVAKLKQSAAKVERNNPGTKPTSRSQKAALIDYITTYISR
jgi:hypothetical protein